MKHIILIFVFICNGFYGQFTINIQAPSNFSDKTLYLYTLDGSKDVLVTKIDKTGNTWKYKFPNKYQGMLKAYFPSSNINIAFISENSNVDFQILDVKNNKITGINFLDESNMLMNKVQDIQSKKESILPALYQIKDYYKPKDKFYGALDDEINRLSQKVVIDSIKHPFINYFYQNYNKFLTTDASKKEQSQQDYITFFSNTGSELETSNLMRPILLAYLGKTSNTQDPSSIERPVDVLLSSVNLETPRGQLILSEFIDIFDSYGMTSLKSKYLSEGESLKCTKTDRLISTINKNKNLEIGAVFPDYKFTNPTHTTAKSISSVKGNKKIIVFWSSTCSHCEHEIPIILEKYNQIKAQGNEVIGLSLDSDQTSYASKANNLPWINDSELKGWNSSVADLYNLHATPTYFIIDSKNTIIAKPDHAKDVLDFLSLK